jgi:serine/threonine protein kinase
VGCLLRGPCVLPSLFAQLQRPSPSKYVAKKFKCSYAPTRHWSNLRIFGFLVVADIVLFMGVATNGDDLYLVQEWISGGSLSRIILDRSMELPWKTRIKMALEIGAALLFLHKKKCLHRVCFFASVLWHAQNANTTSLLLLQDLKCENVLIESNDDGSEGLGRCKVRFIGLHTCRRLLASLLTNKIYLACRFWSFHTFRT